MEMKPCECGCEKLILIRDLLHNKPRRFSKGHNARGKKRTPEDIAKWKVSITKYYQTHEGNRKGCHHTKEAKQKMGLTRLGKKLSKETRQKMSIVRRGANNSFYGKTHSEEQKKKWREERKGKNKGSKNCRWKGGRHKHDKRGHVLVYCPDYPYRKDKYAYEHRLVMEKEIRRQLTRKEAVHHIDKNPANNKIENLMLFDNNRQHRQFEREWEILCRTVQGG